MHILSSQSLFDLVCGNPAMLRWLAQTPKTQVSVSVVSIARVLDAISAEKTPSVRNDLDAAFRQFLAEARTQNAVWPVDERVAVVWAGLGDVVSRAAAAHSVEPISDTERFVVATAIAANLQLVDRSSPCHSAVSRLRLVDPYQ